MADELPDQSTGDLQQINTALRVSPWSSLWWTSGVITSIPGDSVGWMLAQGWEITGVSYDNTTVPPTASYAMAKQQLNNATTLQALLNDFTIRDNDAKWANEVRYNQVIANWTSLMSNTESYLDTQATNQSQHVVLYLADLGTYMTEVDTLIDANRDQIAADAITATAALSGMNTDLDQLETDYDAHSPIATQFLNDLGTTETVRLQEKFAASLATQLQNLTDRGLYSAGVVAGVTARNTRDHNEELAALNDRLAREKWENQHRLYGQQFTMRDRMLTGTQAYATSLMQTSSVLAEHRHKAILEQMNANAARLAGLDMWRQEDMQLMKYMLDTRNQLLVGLYGFIERRDDVAPSWENLQQMVASLADHGGGWVSP